MRGEGGGEAPFHSGKLQRLDSTSAHNMVPSSVHLKICFIQIIFNAGEYINPIEDVSSSGNNRKLNTGLPEYQII